MAKIINKNGKEFPHLMAKEIYDQAEVLKGIIKTYLDRSKHKTRLEAFDKKIKKIKNADQVIIIACGTSYHAGLIGENLISSLAGLTPKVIWAHEFRAGNLVDNKTLVIAISQSGETTDTVDAAKLAKKQGGLLLALVNKPDSRLARLSDITLPLMAGEEKAVTATKTFIAQLALLSILAVYLGRAHGLKRAAARRLVKDIERLPEKVEKILRLNINIQILANKYYKMGHLFALGRKYQYPVALEAALKFKEATYTHAEGLAAGEVKHGPLAAFDKNSPVLFFAPMDSGYQANKQLIKELKQLNKKLIIVTTQGNRQLLAYAQAAIYIPKTHELLSPLLSIIPVQLLAYHIAVLKGINPDKPRNLTKYVV